MSKDWTSISVTDNQKQVLQDYKPDGMAMGVWLVQTVQDAENTAQSDSVSLMELVDNDHGLTLEEADSGCSCPSSDVVREIVREEVRKALRDTLQ